MQTGQITNKTCSTSR